jgi:hypothetical protein
VAAVDFRLLGPAAVAAAMEGAGLTVEVRLERAPYPQENPARRAYLLARRA